MTERMTQNECQKIVKAMKDNDVPQWAFELLAELHHNETLNLKTINSMEYTVTVTLHPLKEFKKNDTHEENCLQAIRKLIICYK
jgi:hypothetical protein